MPIIPEKRQLEDHVHGAVAAQFWSQGIENTRCLTGQTCTAPCEPQPLRLNAPSGLSRTQFLVAAHAVRVPVFPGFCDEHGGAVADRVLLQSGGQKWWGAIIGRAKVQRAVQQHSATTLRKNLADPDNYALAATGRLQLSRSTSLKATMQVDSLQQLQPLMPQGGRIWQQQQQQQGQQAQQRHSSRAPAASSSSSSAGQQRSNSWSKVGQSSSLALQLKQQLEGLELTADLAVNEPAVEGVRRYCTTPLRLAVDLAPSSSSSSSRLKGLLFRIGLHGAVAPVDRGATAAAEQQQQHALSVHCQGAIALTANKTLWEASQQPWQAAAAAAAQQHKRQQQRLRQQEQQQELAVQPLQDDSTGSTSSAVPAAAAAATAAGDAPSSTGATAGSSPAGSETLNNNISSSGSGGTVKSSKHHHSHARTSSSHTTSGRKSSSRHTSSRHGTVKGSSSSSSSSTAASHSSSSSSRQRFLTLRGEEIPLPLANPAAVQEALQDSSSAIERLRTDLRLWTTKVQAGELSGLGQARRPEPGLLMKQPGSCWSSFLSGPHVKVSGLLGVLGRVPLQQQTLLLPSGGSSSTSHLPPHSSSTASLASTAEGLSTGGTGGTSGTAAEDGSTGTGPRTASGSKAAAERALNPSGKPLRHKAASFLAASATHLDRLLLGSAKKLGTSITQDSILRLFGSGGASMQLGEMRGNFFDYTRLEAVLDLGLNAPETPTLANAAGGPAGSGATGARGSAAAAAASRRAAAAAAGSTGGGSSRVGQQGRVAAGVGGGRGAVGGPSRGLGSILGPAAAAVEPTGVSGMATPPVVGFADAGSSSCVAAEQQVQPAAPVPAAAAAPPLPGKLSKHPAFALEERSVWHALTFSATQQLVGPVRLRGDWRFALDSHQPCPRGTALLQPSGVLGVLRHVAGVSPVLVDSALGVDVVVPGGGGLVRLVGWYSPGRREGGLEVRLM